MTADWPAIDEVVTSTHDFPTDQPEGDGTLAWSSTTVVVVRARAGGREGLGWTYGGTASATAISGKLAGVVEGHSPADVPRINEAMIRACRNMGVPGAVACAISAVDIALWDLKARLLDVPLADLFGRARDEVPIYGSGGFTTYDDARTTEQLEKWVGEWRIPRVKIKIGESWGNNTSRDLHRVALARKVIGDDVELYVDANGAYSRKQAVRMGWALGEHGVSWYEEPVSSDDLEGLHQVRNSCPADCAAGEYGYTLNYFEKMLSANAVDCLQIDVTRCGGYSIWLRAAALAAARNIQVSGHCAPNLHAHIGVAMPNLRHLEYFHDHHRIENELFDGALSPEGGSLVPDADRPGHGMSLRASD
jgi:L-alanine-DL-glutamate epimerase-like enolase superfamily enzyme